MFLLGEAQGEFLCVLEQWGLWMRAHSWKCERGDQGTGSRKLLLPEPPAQTQGFTCPALMGTVCVQWLPTLAMPTGLGCARGLGAGARDPLGRAGHAEEGRMPHLPRLSDQPDAGPWA